ncbi:MAG: hypothetical protein ACKO6R_08485 [Burkholderiaceae bacterium]
MVLLGVDVLGVDVLGVVALGLDVLGTTGIGSGGKGGTGWRRTKVGSLDFSRTVVVSARGVVALARGDAAFEPAVAANHVPARGLTGWSSLGLPGCFFCVEELDSLSVEASSAPTFSLPASNSVRED